MHRLICAAIVSAALLAPAAAFAQDLPKWDAGFGVGLLFGNGLVREGERNWDDSIGEVHFAAGRYWTTHLKTDVGVMIPKKRHLYDYAPVLGITDPFAGYVATETTRTVTAASAALTYQFFENDFVHPYVSGDLQAAFAHDHIERQPQVVTINRVRQTFPGLDERTTSVLLRPFAAVGCKSYLNSHTFVRSELLAAAGGRGFSHAVVRLGFGVDF